MTSDRGKVPPGTMYQPGWNVRVQGDFIQTTGDVHLTRRSSKADFVRELGVLRRQIADLAELAHGDRQAATGNIDAAVQEAEREPPSKDTILQRLDTVKGTIAKIAGTTEDAEKIVGRIGKLMNWALAALA